VNQSLLPKIVLLLVCCPSLIFAQDLRGYDLGNIDSADMQKALEQANIIQACLAKVDQDELQALKSQADAMTNEVRAICAAGKRSEAQAIAIMYGKQLLDEPVAKELQACVGIDLAIPQTAWARLDSGESGKAHVCDL